MKSSFMVRSILLVSLALLVLPGCPPDVGVQIQISPESLDFGQTSARQVLKVHKNYSAGTMDPLVATASHDWIMPQSCLSTSDRCVSNGPMNKIRIPVVINRGKLDLGLNVGKVFIKSGSLSVEVPVAVDEIAKADFVAQQTRVSYGRPVQFTDLSLVAPQAGDIKFWRWDFGDGKTSALRNPAHVYTQTGAFTVKLTIETTRGVKRTAEKAAYVYVEDPAVTVDFSASRTNIILGDSIVFTDLSSSANAPILSRKWNFGDGNSSTEASPTHIYAVPGIFDVSLTIETAAGSYSANKQNYIVVRELAGLQVDFTYENAFAGEETQFIPIVFGALGELTYFWDFGDGANSTEKSPIHRFAARAQYEVELTVTDEKETAVIRKTVDLRYRPPQALFTAKPTRQSLGSSIEFTDHSIEGFGAIVAWRWSFGDGNVSVSQNPVHTYNKTGKYTVSLEVTANDPEQQTASLTRVDYIEIIEGTVPDAGKLDLEDYVNSFDSCFDYSTPRMEFVRVQGQPLAKAYMIDKMTSLCWNPDGDVYAPGVPWTHTVAIIEPLAKVSNTAMLFIDGGSRNTTTATYDDVIAQVAILSGTTIVHIKNVPSQPIVFNDEVILPDEEDNYSGADKILRARSEDAIIAYSYDKYLRSYRDSGGNPTREWPVLFPMVKAAVRAMDMAETILATDGVQIDSFVVAGASKRGWTTWLTGAVDSRVKGIAPIVINVLNMKPHLEHHRASYGYWSPAIYDYAQKGIFDELISTTAGQTITPEAQALLEQVDPYEYALRGRYPMPKFMLNATGDEFFVPDTTQYYFDDLEADKHLSYVPNVGHGMGGLDEEDITGYGQDATSPARMLLAWYMAVTQGRPLPGFTQRFEEDGAITVEIDPGYAPVAVRLWQATVEGVRDFRNRGGATYEGPEWTSSVLAAQSAGVYRARPADPETGSYRGFFIQLEYTNPAELPLPAQLSGFSKPNLIFSTGVRVLPVEVGGAPSFPIFDGYNANVVRPDAVPFPDAKMPVAVVYGAPYDMGRYYGELLASDINDFIPQYLDAYKSATGQSDGFLTDRWNLIAGALGERVLDEIEGIADGLGVNVSLSMLQMAHAAALYTGDIWNASSTMAHAPLLTDNSAGHVVSVNNRLDLNVVDTLVAVVYIPNKGAPHTILTHPGLAVGYAGVNLGGISVAETPNPIVASEGLSGLTLMRRVLYDAFSLRDAVAIVQTEALQDTSLILGDGRNERRGARIRTGDTGGQLPVRFDLASEDFSLQRPGIVYDSRPDWRLLLRQAIQGYIGDLKLTDLYTLGNQSPFAAPATNILNVLFDSAQMNISINKAEAPLGASNNVLPLIFNMQQLLP